MITTERTVREAGATRFLSVGQVVATPAALATFDEAVAMAITGPVTPESIEPRRKQMIANLVKRHMRGDWGDVSEHDWQANDQALDAGGERVVSAYHVGPNNTRVWVITEADRGQTTVMLPEDY